MSNLDFTSVKFEWCILIICVAIICGLCVALILNPPFDHDAELLYVYTSLRRFSFWCKEYEIMQDGSLIIHTIDSYTIFKPDSYSGVELPNGLNK